MSRIQLIVRTSLQIALLSMASIATAQQEPDENTAPDNAEAAAQNEDVNAEAQQQPADEAPALPEAVQRAPVAEPSAPAAELDAPTSPHPAPVVEQAVAALEPPAAAPAPAPAAPVKLDTPEDLRRRIAKAREIVEVQRKKAPLPEEVPAGLSREELEIRAGERNISAYDKQINTGEGTDAMAAFRKLAVETVAATRRRQYTKVFGDAIHDPDAPALLRAHAQRMAQLRRIRMFAEIKRFPALAKRADELMVKSDAWLKERMQALQAPAVAQKDTASSEPAAGAVPK